MEWIEIWSCILGVSGLTQVYQHLISDNSLLFLISWWDLITVRSCLYLDFGKGNLVRTKSDGKIQGSSTKWGIAMETNQLCLNCLLWPFSSVIVSSDESGSTMLHSLELSAVCSATVLVTIAGRLLCSLLIPGKPCGCRSNGENAVIASAVTIALLP